MHELPELRVDGETAPIDLPSLDEDLRSGRLSPEAELRWAPWTGDRFERIARIPALAEAIEAPDAAFAARLRAGRRPRLALALTGVVALSAGLPLLTAAGLPPEALGAGALGLGLEPLVFDGGWWRPWTWQLVHAGFMHLLPNLVVLGFMAARVERALGPLALALVAATSLLTGAATVLALSESLVVGASTLGFGVWAAQLAIGFRFGPAIPPALAGRYGYGNLWFFGVLLANSLAGEGVSHEAHAGGFLGGALVAMAITPAFMRPRAARARARARHVALLVAVSALTLALGPLLRAAPRLATGAPTAVTLPEAGVSLEVPARMLPDGPGGAATVRGMPAWSLSPGSELKAFVGLDELSWAEVAEGDPLVGEALAASWTRLGGGQARAVEPPAPRAPGWTAHAFLLLDQGGQPRYRLVEHHLLRGRSLLRAGYLVRADGRLDPDPREAVFMGLLQRLVVGDPPALARARERHAAAPTSPRARQELARALAELGDFEQADALYALAAEAPGAAGLSAARERLALWVAHPRVFSSAPTPAWFEPWLEQHPAERKLQVHGITWLAGQGRCLAARAHHEAFANARPEAAELVATAEAVLRCEGRL